MIIILNNDSLIDILIYVCLCKCVCLTLSTLTVSVSAMFVIHGYKAARTISNLTHSRSFTLSQGRHTELIMAGFVFEHPC